jgi:hypothetical protein
MHEYRKAAREGAASKLKSYEAGEPHKKVDSSSWSPPAMEEANVQTGMRPVSPRQYKSGGKVHGEHAKKRADRKARKSGGEVMPPVDRLINRDMKKANALREGVKHIGGMKKGGKVKREHHADGDPAGSSDDIAKIIRQAEIEQNMKGRGIPARVPLPPRRPVEPDHYIPDTTLTTQGAKKGGKIRSKHAKGGAAHPDEAEDKALIRKMVKASARTGKLSGGTLGSYIDKARENYLNDPDDLKNKQRMTDGVGLAASKISGCSGAKVPATYKKGGRTHKLSGGALVDYINAAAADMGKTGAKQPFDFNRASKRSEGVDLAARKLADQNVNVPASGMKKGGRTKHASGGEAGRGLYVRQNYPHEVPGADGGRTAKKRGGAIGKGKTNVNIMIHPHNPMGAMGAPAGMPPMGGPAMPPPPPPRPPMPPMGAMGAGAPMAAPMGAVGAGMPPMGAARPGMPPIGRKSGGKVEHVIDHAAGGGLGRLEKIKAYGLE